MKKIFLALLAVVAMVACEDNLEGKSGEATEFDFAFNESGECYSTKTNGISASVFAEQVVGYGWKIVSSFEILENGKFSEYEWWGMMDGGTMTHIYFESKNVIKSFVETMVSGGDIICGYYTDNILFDNSKVYFADSRNKYRYLVLTVDEKSMTCIEGVNNTYVFTTFQRMTPEELEKVQQTYTRNWDEAE